MSLKARDNLKNLLTILTSSIFGENTRQGVTKCKNKRYGVSDIIIEEKFYTFKNPEIKFRINKALSRN